MKCIIKSYQFALHLLVTLATQFFGYSFEYIFNLIFLIKCETNPIYPF